MAFNDFRDAARFKPDFYGTNGGPAIPAGRGLRRIGSTPPRLYPLEAYQPPVVSTPAPGGSVNVLPSDTVAPKLPGSAPPPALRAPGVMTGVSERGFTMSGSPYTDTINTTARPYTTPTPSAPSAPQGRIAYNPVRVAGPGIEGMGDFAPEGAPRARVAGRFGFKSLARGAGGALRAATGPVPLAVSGLATVAGMQANATANSNGPIVGLRRDTPLFGAPGPGRSIATGAIYNTDPYTQAPVSVTQSVDQGVGLPGTPSLKMLAAHKPGEVLTVGPPATDDPAYYNQGRGGSAADALKEVSPADPNGFAVVDGKKINYRDIGLQGKDPLYGQGGFVAVNTPSIADAEAKADFDRRKGIFEAGGEAQYAIKQRLGYVPADYNDNKAAYDAAMLKDANEITKEEFSLKKQALANQGLIDAETVKGQFTAAVAKDTKLEEERIKQAGLLEQKKEVNRGLRWAAEAKETEEQKLMAAAEVAQAVENAKITGKSISDALARGREGQVIEEQGGAVWPFGNRSKKIWTEAPGKKIVATRVVNGVKQVKYADGTIR